MKPGSILRAIMTGRRTPGVIPHELLTTDRILDRWSVDSGSGLPTAEWDDTPHARPVPLDSDTWLVVDREIRTSPDSTRRFVVGWYTSPLPTSVQADKAGMELRTYQKIHLLTLNFMRYRFAKTGNLTLQRLLAALEPYRTS